MSLSVKPQFPLFYKSLVPFSSTAHRSLTLPKVQSSHAFASHTDIIPLLVSEVPQAVRHFPIVFIKDRSSSAVTMVALVGKGDGRNQLVDANGQWQQGVYIPAWVRRYPFALMADAKGDSMLAVDVEAAIFEDKSEAQPLVDSDGKPTELLQKIVEFNKEFLAMSKLTEQVTQALVHAEVLEDAGISIRQAQSDKPLTVQGFMVVNEKKLKALTTEQLDKLHRADALGMAYAQLLSMGNLSQLLNRPVS
jgi:hypothetical protein